jgi:hypothetical protein
MSIVFVNDWNGYGGGIFDTFENALEDMAILAFDKGTEGHKDHTEDFAYLLKPLQDVGFGGTANDRNLYTVVTSPNYSTFSIVAHDTKTRPGHTAKTVTLVGDRMIDPAWLIQKSLFEYASEDYVGPEGVREALMEDVDVLVDRAFDRTDSPAEALAAIRGTGLTGLAAAVHKELFPADIEDPAEFLDTLPERAAEIFDGIVAKAFPTMSTTTVSTP